MRYQPCIGILFSIMLLSGSTLPDDKAFISMAGNILKEKKDITTAAGRYQNPTIARTPSGLLHVFWFNKPEDKDEPSRIFLKTSTDNGLTWENRGTQTMDKQN
jgi:Neuraminidase (sialidase)